MVLGLKGVLIVSVKCVSWLSISLKHLPSAMVSVKAPVVMHYSTEKMEYNSKNIIVDFIRVS